MTNTELLREIIDRSGYKLRYIAQCIGITYQGLLKKINNESEFKASEISSLHHLLQMSEQEREAVFFAEDVDKISTFNFNKQKGA